MNTFEILIIASLVFVGGCSSYAKQDSAATQSTENYYPSSENEGETVRGNDELGLKQEFIEYAEAYAASKGYRFGSGAKIMFRDEFAINAANALMNVNTSQIAVEKNRSREATRKLIDRMIYEANTIPGYAEKSPGVIGEQTLANAQRFLCPLWPICK